MAESNKMTEAEWVEYRREEEEREDEEVEAEAAFLLLCLLFLVGVLRSVIFVSEGRATAACFTSLS
jgi:hypothetical protein